MTDSNQDSAYTENDLQRAKEAIDGNLTPQALLEMESMINSIDDATKLPEAGGIVFTEFEGEHGGVLHVTARAAHPTRAIQMLLESYAYLRSVQPAVHWHVQDASKGKAPMPTQVVRPPATTDPSEPQYVDVHSEQPAPAPPAGGAEMRYQMQITKIEITPKPDGKADVGLFAPGHKWADLRIINWDAPSIMTLVDPSMGWDVNTLMVANYFTGNFVAEWEYSTKNFKQSGEPYKDVKRIAAA